MLEDLVNNLFGEGSALHSSMANEELTAIVKMLKIADEYKLTPEIVREFAYSFKEEPNLTIAECCNIAVAEWIK